MQYLAVFLLVVAAATASELKKDEKTKFRCSLLAGDHWIHVKEQKYPIYVCNSDEGDRVMFAAENLKEDKLEASIEKETTVKLRDLSHISRPKRQFGFGGFGGGGANSYAQSSAGGFGGGGGLGGLGGGGFGGGFSQAQAGSQAGGFGGGGLGGFGK